MKNPILRPEHPAFPTPENGLADGITKREYFAALALQGLLGDSSRNGDFKDFSEDAVKYADALIKALNADNTLTCNNCSCDSIVA